MCVIQREFQSAVRLDPSSDQGDTPEQLNLAPNHHVICAQLGSPLIDSISPSRRELQSRRQILAPQRGV
jgi:hypothetical protein